MKYIFKGLCGYMCIGDQVVNINIKGYLIMK